MYVNESVVIFILGKITEHLNESLFPTPDPYQHYYVHCCIILSAFWQKINTCSWFFCVI